MEFWNSELTEESWKRLIELRGEIGFVLIGGWAVYLYSRLHKSRDIDIIIDYGALNELRGKYAINKNDRLHKYEIKLEKFDIDIYLPNYSRLTIPAEDILSDYKKEVDGFAVPIPEVLLALKLGAMKDRVNSLKGSKDQIDVLGLLFYSGIDLALFSGIMKKYGLTDYLRDLQRLLRTFDKDMLKYVNLNEKSFSELKRKRLEEIGRLV